MLEMTPVSPMAVGCMENSTVEPVFISIPRAAWRGNDAPVPVGSAPKLSHRRTEPQPSCRACGTYLHGLNAPGNNLPIRHVPTPRRSASDRPLDHRALTSALWEIIIGSPTAAS